MFRTLLLALCLAQRGGAVPQGAPLFNSFTNPEQASLFADVSRHSWGPRKAISNPEFESNIIDRVLEILGFKKNRGFGFFAPDNYQKVCPFSALPLIKDTTSIDFADKYQVCDPWSLASCPSGYVCERSRRREYYICCSDSLIPAELVKKKPKFHAEKASKPPPQTFPVVVIDTSRYGTAPRQSKSGGSQESWNPWKTKPSTGSSTGLQISRVTSPTSTPDVSQETISTDNWPSTLGQQTVTSRQPWNPRGTIPPDVSNIWGRTDSPSPVPVTNLPIFPPDTTEGFTFSPLATQSSSPSTPDFPGQSTAAPGTPNSTIPTLVLLRQGRYRSLDNNRHHLQTSITLIHDQGTYILVDTGLPADAGVLIQELQKQNLKPGDVDTLVITHGHPAHVGNLNLFSSKTHVFSEWEYLDHRFSKTRLAEAQIRRLTQNTELWKTPGHTQDDLSVVVKDLQNYGTVAIVGDLIPSEDFVRDPFTSTFFPSWNRKIQQQNMRTVVCIADWIIPGHGPMFKVKPEYKVQSNCKSPQPSYAYAPYYFHNRRQG